MNFAQLLAMKVIAELLPAMDKAREAQTPKGPTADGAQLAEDSCPCAKCVARRAAGVPLHSLHDLQVTVLTEMEKQMQRQGVPHADDSFVAACRYLAETFSLVGLQLSQRSLDNLGFSKQPTSKTLEKIKAAFIEKVKVIGDESAEALRYLVTFKAEQNRVIAEQAADLAS